MRGSRPLRQAISWRHPAFAAALLGLLTSACAAQTPQDEPDSQPTPGRPYVLHVYTDLLQVPAMVLDWHGRPSTRLGLHDFKLQIDSGPAFTPAAIHPEGNEPLTLAMVLDASGAEDDLIAALPKSPTHGYPNGLLPHDHVRVYAFDCKSLRSNLDGPADETMKQDGIAHILASPLLHKPNAPRKTCQVTKHVWDAVAAAATDIGQEPGRRALIVISDGDDEGSSVPLENLMTYAEAKSISVFVIRRPPDPATPMRMPRGIGDTVQTKDPLRELAGDTGGYVLTAMSNEVMARLDSIVTMLRSRYILQFPRPMGTGGTHHLDVHVSESGDTVYAAGITFPSRDAALMNDPDTVPTDTSKLPVVGRGKH